MPWAKMCMKLDTVNLDDVILNPQKNQDHRPNLNVPAFIRSNVLTTSRD